MRDGPQIVQRVATKALIVNEEGRILILREAKTYEEGTNIGRYHFPGGRLNPGEAFFDGLKREVDEETGLEIEIGKPIYVGEWRPIIKGVPNQIVAIFFICKPITSNIRLSEEHDDFQWVLPTEASNYDVMSPEDKVMEAYIDSLS
jgi:8-oxo-dGTP diphosphatase